MISVDEALDIVLRITSKTLPEDCPIFSATGRILASDIIAPHDQPPWDNSAMDGYAVRWEDIQSVTPGRPVWLKIIEVIPSGSMPHHTVLTGCCSKIMTGAPIPHGANTVVPVEETEIKEQGVLVKNPIKKGEHIRLRGEDVSIGKTILNKGKLIRSPEIAMLASLGQNQVLVFKKPKVGILSTGDELAELDDARAENKIYNSNGYSLYAQVLEAGGDPFYLGIAHDSKEELLRKVNEGSFADILVLSGGVSMGDWDFVKEILISHGKTNFWRVAMRPGSPIAYGEFNGKPFFGLPGNPVSCMVTFKIFVEPLIKKMMGAAQFRVFPLTAIMSHEVRKKKGLRFFYRGIVTAEKNELMVRTTGEQGSHLIHSIVKANCLIDIPEYVEKVDQGQKIPVIPLSPFVC